MHASFVSLVQDQIEGNTADFLFIDIEALRQDYQYLGFWYACDKNEDTFIATEFYYGDQASGRPNTRTEEITENSYKKTPRIALDLTHSALWIATRVETGRYCRFQPSSFVEEKSFINYKVIRNRGSAYDTLKTGVLKGDTARFSKIGIEDGSGAVDYNDTIFFLVGIRSLPPPDWKFDPGAFGVHKLPIVVPTFLFSVRGSYSRWLGQDPCEGVS